MIAVTGAGGKTGLAVVKALAERGVAVRGLVRKEADQERLAAAGGRESVVGMLEDRTTLEKLMRDVRAVYYICPNMHPDEVAIGATLLETAQVAGVQHFVYHSVLHPQTQAMSHHWHKLLVEERIFASGLPFTILQPTAYMQNLLGYWNTIRDAGVYAVPYPVSTRLSLVDVNDVAEVAARVLTEPGHAGATYELVGTLPLTQIQVAECLSAKLRRSVVAKEVALEQWEQGVRQQGVSGYALQTLRQMFSYYAANGLVGNPQVLGWLLGRAPVSLEEFVQRTAAQ